MIGSFFRRLGVFVFLVPGLAATVSAAELAARVAARNSISADELRDHAAWLADDTLEGREAGKRGGQAAARYLVDKLQAIGLTGAGEDGGFVQSFYDENRNILALLPGSDPTLRDEFVVVGAHFDHVGYGNSRNSFGPTGYIHNGADDNASGVSALLETAQALKMFEGGLKRSILFAFWDAEEKGMYGSKYWLARPTVPVERVRTYINLDMVGRLRDRVEVSGTRTGDDLRKIITALNTDGLWLDYRWEMREDSDHYPFYARRIPTLMFHTGRHADYHRPSDDAEKLNIEGMQAVSRLVLDLIIELADARQLPAFRDESFRECVSEAGREALEKPLPPLAGRMGISWRQGVTREAGALITAVHLRGPAATAGLRVGDSILAWDGVPLESDDEFQRLALRHDGTVNLTIAPRGGLKHKTVAVALAGTPIRIGLSWVLDDAEPSCVLVKRVVPYSPAARSGLKNVDRIYAVNGTPFSGSEEFGKLLDAADKALKLTIDRGGVLYHVPLELDAGVGAQ